METRTRNRIREHREKYGISQSQLGRKVALSEAAINRYERGRRKPSKEIMMRIAEALGVPLRELFVDLSGQGSGGEKAA